MRELTLAEFDLIVGGDNTVSPVTVTASSGGSGSFGGGYGGEGGSDTGGGGNTQQVGYVDDLVKGILNSAWYNPLSTLDRNQKSTYDPKHEVGTSISSYEDLGLTFYIERMYMDDGTYWIDIDKNGTPESHFSEINGSTYIDTNFDGVYETKAVN